MANIHFKRLATSNQSLMNKLDKYEPNNLLFNSSEVYKLKKLKVLYFHSLCQFQESRYLVNIN